MSRIKIKRAKAIAKLGPFNASFEAMLDYIPSPVLQALSSRQIAAQIDALWTCAENSKAIALREQNH